MYNINYCTIIIIVMYCYCCNKNKKQTFSRTNFPLNLETTGKLGLHNKKLYNKPP